MRPSSAAATATNANSIDQAAAPAARHARRSLPSKRSDFDVIVIGGGPAGLSAALVLGRCVRTVAVFDSGRYRNARSTAMHCYLGHDGIAPADFRDICRKQLARYDTVAIIDQKVSQVTVAAQGFTVLAAERAYSCSRLLVASGVEDELPSLPGIEQLFGRSVHVCPYCDGWELRDAAVAVYGAGEKGAALALMLRRWTHDLVLCTNGSGELSPALRRKLDGQGIVVEEERIAALEGVDGRLERVRLESGRSIPRKALFFTTGQHPRSPLLASLGCDHSPERGTICDDNGLTSVEGVYVAGDASRDVQLVTMAAAEGARVGLAINKALMKEEGLMD